jgi:DNA-binding beta-propeller fold protein YncE
LVSKKHKGKIVSIIILIAIIIIIALWIIPKPKYTMHCYDGILNRGELGVDCGGSCEAICGQEIIPFQVDPISVTDVAIAKDFVLVVDEMRHRIMAYNKKSLLHVDTIGERTTNDAEGNIKFINGGTDDDLFRFPSNVVYKNGKIYILDRFNQKIKVYSNELDFIETISLPKELINLIPTLLDTPSVDAGILGFDVGTGFYFTDDRTGTVAKLIDGKVTSVNVDNPTDIVVDKEIYVIERNNQRIKVLDKNLEFIKNIDVPDSRPSGIAIAGNNIYIADHKNHQIIKLDKKGKLIKKNGGLGNGINQFYLPSRLVYDKGQIYVADSGNQRVVVLDKELNYVKELASLQTQIMGALFAPFFITVSDEVFVSDPLNNKVIFFDKTGVYLGKIGLGKGFSNEHFNNPSGIASDIEGNIYVADKNNNRIQIFDNELNHKNTIKDIYSPMALSFGNGKLYAVEDDTKTIKVYEELKLIKTIDDIKLPLGVLANNEKLIVTNDFGRTINVFDKEFNLIEKINIPDSIGELDESLALTQDNRLVFADNTNRKGVIYDFDTKLFESFGDFGEDQDELTILEVAIEGNKIYITDMKRSRVKVFDLQLNEVMEFGSGEDGMLETFGV